ncbi:helix-turn-helix domain-containing protein [Mucilaginibacter sp.]
MEDSSHIKLDNLLYSCVDRKQRSNEQFVAEHAFGYIISGETHMATSEGIKVMRAGDIGLVRRNQLLKSIKIPPPDGEFKSLNIFLEQGFLRKYAIEYKIEQTERYTGISMMLLSPDPFIKGYFDSLIPYFDRPEHLKSALGELKTKEAIQLLLQHDPALKSFLFDFSEPWKIDLETYMNKNYMYNVPIAQFAKLTGRSLAGFKRDFTKIFKTSPSYWLQQRRLSEAYFLIKDKRRKPSEIYLDLGFENFSHFSYTFKNTFGVSPTRL